MHMPCGTALTAARFVCKSLRVGEFAGNYLIKSQLCRIDTEERKSETTPWPPGPTLHRRPPILLFVKWHAAARAAHGRAGAARGMFPRPAANGPSLSETRREGEGGERARAQVLPDERRHLLSRQASSDDCSEGLSRFLPTKKQLAVKGRTRWCTLPLPRALADEDESIDARRVTPRPEHLQRKVPRKLMWRSGASATPPDRP